jgi:hypothetical protein
VANRVTVTVPKDVSLEHVLLSIETCILLGLLDYDEYMVIFPPATVRLDQDGHLVDAEIERG